MNKGAKEISCTHFGKNHVVPLALGNDLIAGK
jgi:hypothetical protein